MLRRRIKVRKYQAALIAATLVIMLGQAGKAETRSAKTRKPAAPVQVSANAEAPVATSASPEPQATRTASPAAPPMTADDRLPFMASDDRSSSADQPSGFGMIARTLGALLLVIGLLVAGSWCLKRIKGSPFRGSREDGHLEVLKTVTLGDRRSLTVARFGERILLIGSTPQSFALLAADDPEGHLSLLPEELPARSVAEVLSASEDYHYNQAPSFARELEQQDEWR